MVLQLRGVDEHDAHVSVFGNGHSWHLGWVRVMTRSDRFKPKTQMPIETKRPRPDYAGRGRLAMGTHLGFLAGNPGCPNQSGRRQPAVARDGALCQ